jgi:3-ketosteroid 9alpha-monooxygenase subunit A
MTVRYAFEQSGHFARGWHVVMFSQELGVGAIRKLKFFGQELVIFRGESGSVSVHEAYCPHLGANLGNPHAKVIGDTIRCPFHGWQFDHRGHCVHIPNATAIPDRARDALGAWQVREKCGFIALWHDHEGTQPSWELPDIEQWGQPEWGDWAFRRSRIPTQGREIIETMADKAHFAFVHGDDIDHFELVFDGISVTQHNAFRMNSQRVRIFPDDTPDWIRELVKENDGATGTGKATYYGPAVMYFYCEVVTGEDPYRSWWLNFHTPIDEHEVELTSGVLLAPLHPGDELSEEFRERYPEVAHSGFAGDIEIWKDKKYHSDPILCDADGPINKLRKWYDQFYQVDPAQ